MVHTDSRVKPAWRWMLTRRSDSQGEFACYTQAAFIFCFLFFFPRELSSSDEESRFKFGITAFEAIRSKWAGEPE